MASLSESSSDYINDDEEDCTTIGNDDDKDRSMESTSTTTWINYSFSGIPFVQQSQQPSSPQRG